MAHQALSRFYERNLLMKTNLLVSFMAILFSVSSFADLSSEYEAQQRARLVGGDVEKIPGCNKDPDYCAMAIYILKLDINTIEQAQFTKFEDPCSKNGPKLKAVYFKLQNGQIIKSSGAYNCY